MHPIKDDPLFLAFKRDWEESLATLNDDLIYTARDVRWFAAFAAVLSGIACGLLGFAVGAF